MKEVHYLLDSIDDAAKLENELIADGVAKHKIHFMAENSRLLNSRGLNTTSIFEESDLIRKVIQGAFWGFFYGIVFVLLVDELKPYDWQPSSLGYMAAVASAVFVFCYTGALIGLNTENYKVKNLHKQLSEGKVLLVLNCTDDESTKVCRKLDKTHMVDAAPKDALFNPFITV